MSLPPLTTVLPFRCCCCFVGVAFLPRTEERINLKDFPSIQKMPKHLWPNSKRYPIQTTPIQDGPIVVPHTLLHTNHAHCLEIFLNFCLRKKWLKYIANYNAVSDAHAIQIPKSVKVYSFFIPFFTCGRLVVSCWTLE